ncbi:cation:proton antiporter domain-containing protein [Halobellus rufus]|uniref:cation:proton antiporter domain-containing protein n=1 Tax=Halobellus rufus TaxID=1448860 RepID=UPI000679D9D6|nr:cation:proton antiporter [Halobellus rufus]
MASSLLPVVALILVSGIGVQLLAGRIKVPSVVFYLVVGLLLGPEFLGLVTIETFGNGLSTVVGLSVAIIVFDGAFALQFDRIREASTASLRLVTVGAVVTFLGTAGAVRVLEGSTWEIALVVGALLVATGPTVITPILEVVRVREHVAAALETEGIINDVTAAIAAVVIFETMLLDDVGISGTMIAFLERAGVGVAAGLFATGLIYFLLKHELTPEGGPQTARFLTFSAAIGSFALAEAVAAEAGIAAAATAGIALGNLELPHRETIEEFARDATLIVLAFVFVSLAALIDIDAILQLGVGGILLVAVVMLVLRPVVVWIATFGIRQFNRSERLFLAAMGPRGIIPASVATLFAIELATAGNQVGSQILLGTVFVVIVATDAIEAGLARQIGDALGVTPMRTIIVGGGRVGLALATRLEQRGEFVVLIEEDEKPKRAAREAGITVYEGDGTESETLRGAGIDEARIVVAATDDDNVNLLVCQTARTKFDVEDVYARVNDPQNMAAFEALSVTAVDGPMSTAFAIDNEIERPELANWMYDASDGHDIQEITMTAEEFVGESVRDLNDRIPGGCLIAEIGQNEEAHVPDPDEVLEYGDHLTFLGDAAAVEEAVKRFHPRE